MTQIKLLAAAGDWAAGSVATVDDAQAQRLIRTGYAVTWQAVAEQVQRISDAADTLGAAVKRSRKERTH